MEPSRRRLCHATASSWRFCRVGMDLLMSGSHNPVRGSSITLLAEALRNSSIPRSGFWDSRPMAPWSRFGFASQPAKAGRSAYGRYQRWAASPGPIWKARRSSIGRTTVRGSPTIRLLQEIRFSFRTARRILKDQYLPRLRACMLTFRCGRPTIGSSTSSTARFPTNWTSGALSRQAECRNGSRHTMGA